jgi:hypothetical protein
VPEPQDTLAQHTADFARMGFTPIEMIQVSAAVSSLTPILNLCQLVACGHSLGGVQNTAFPFTAQAPGTANNTSGNEFFDTTFTIFDNKMCVRPRLFLHVRIPNTRSATDYISGQSINPLVVGPNVTTRSDARIFASDGNVTMTAYVWRL